MGLGTDPGEYRLHWNCPACGEEQHTNSLIDRIETVEYACGRKDQLDIIVGMGRVNVRCPTEGYPVAPPESHVVG